MHIVGYCSQPYLIFFTANGFAERGGRQTFQHCFRARRKRDGERGVEGKSALRGARTGGGGRGRGHFRHELVAFRELDAIPLFLL